MPAHILFLARHALIGFALAAGFVGAMAGFDIAGLRTLAAQSGSVAVVFPVLAFFLGLTFASVQMGAAIMLMPREEGGDRGPGLGARIAAALAPPPAMAPARVRARR